MEASKVIIYMMGTKQHFYFFLGNQSVEEDAEAEENIFSS